VIFSLEILERGEDECVLILVIYWEKNGVRGSVVVKALC
jgi:hypothetical protein